MKPAFKADVFFCIKRAESSKKKAGASAPAFMVFIITEGSSENDKSAAAVDCKECRDEYEGYDRHKLDQDVDGRT